MDYIKIDYSLLDHPLYFNGKFDKVHAWIDLLLLANDADRTITIGGIEVEVKRGQVAKSIRFLADRWQWSTHTVQGFLKRLEAATLIATPNKKPILLITIVKYDFFKVKNEEAATPIATPIATPPATPNATPNATPIATPNDLNINTLETAAEKTESEKNSKTATPKRKKETKKDEKVSPTPFPKEEINKEEKEEEKANNKLLGGKGQRPPASSPIDERKQWLIDSIKDANVSCPRDMLNEFYLYWSETTPGGRKMRFELEKTWVTSRRLARWYNNNQDKKWNK